MRLLCNEQLDIELIGLNDLRAEGKFIPEVIEDGNTPLENARLKAMAYYEAFQIPVFSCDSGLYFDNVPDEVQPGVHVRNVNGKSLSDDEMIDYYSGLGKKYGNLVARYRNAICFVMDDTHIYEAMEPSMESEKFILTDDLPEDRLEQVAVEDGFSKGLLRYNLFWDNTPFCTMLYVDSSSQKKGFGRMLIELLMNKAL